MMLGCKMDKNLLYAPLVPAECLWSVFGAHGLLRPVPLASNCRLEAPLGGGGLCPGTCRVSSPVTIGSGAMEILCMVTDSLGLCQYNSVLRDPTFGTPNRWKKYKNTKKNAYKMCIRDKKLQNTCL